MTQTARTARPATALVPGQRTPLAAPPTTGRQVQGTARRWLAIALGARSLRPVAARAQEPYGESDGQ